MNRFFAVLVKAYQLTLSPFVGGQCRFVPSCSDYACECLEKHSTLKSIGKIGWRILRCNPWSAGGYDPVEQEQVKQNSIQTNR